MSEALEKLTIGDLKKLKEETKDPISPAEWKRRIKKFGIDHELTVWEAIDVGHFVFDFDFKAIFRSGGPMCKDT